MKKVELFNDHFQNFKVYGIPHAQLYCVKFKQSTSMTFVKKTL